MSGPKPAWSDTLRSRRSFLKSSSVALISAAFPHIIQANINESSDRTLEFINLHTNETLGCCYWQNGAYDPNALAKIDYLLRDHRAEEVYPIDRQLLDLLHSLRDLAGSNAPFEVISGYRSPKTNTHLRKTSGGVAKRSLHMQGKAIDIRLPDIKLENLRDMAVSLQNGGVGYYAKSNFLHIDIGRTRRW